MMREILEVVMLLSLVGGVAFVRHVLIKEKQERAANLRHNDDLSRDTEK